MNSTHNTNGLPYGMSHVTNPDFIRAGQFLYSIYPGIHKMRIKRKGRTKRSVTIRIISGTDVQRTKEVKGYSLSSAVANIMEFIKNDPDMSSRLKHPELYIS